TVAAHHVLCAARRHGADAERPYAQTQSPGTVGPTCTGHAAVRLERVSGCSGGDTGVDGGTALVAGAMWGHHRGYRRCAGRTGGDERTAGLGIALRHQAMASLAPLPIINRFSWR